MGHYSGRYWFYYYINTHRYASVSYPCSGSVAQRDLVCESEFRACWVWTPSSVIISSSVVVYSRKFVVCDNIIIISHWAVCVYCLDCEHESWGSQNLESQVMLSKYQGFYYYTRHYFSNKTFSMSNLFNKHDQCIWYLKLLSCKHPKSWVIWLSQEISYFQYNIINKMILINKSQIYLCSLWVLKLQFSV